ncbi:MAG: polyphenol oxidase family protein [bacterium]|nr:polyphenol oxidase family protein [bacterium]
MILYFNFKIYSSNIQDLDQKRIINRIKLIKNKINKLNVILPIQKHTNKILNLSELFYKDLNYLDKLKILETGFDGIYFDKNDLYLLEYFGLGVLTADCLPIIIFIFQDNLNNEIYINNNWLSNFIMGGILHAGWKGIFYGIIYNFFKILNNYIKNSHVLRIFVYIGPSIRSCCYEVKPDFINQNNISKEFYYLKNNKIYLNLIDIAKKQIDNSIKNIKANIQKTELIDKNECTYCSNKYFSYRKGHKTERNITVLYL